MYTQSFEDAGRDAAASASADIPLQATSWRQLPPQANGTEATSREVPPAYEENLQTVLEDSERHLDALWNMLNSQMNRLSHGYVPTTEAQATHILSLTEQTDHAETAEQPIAEDTALLSQNLTAALESEAMPVTRFEAEEATPVAMPFNFMPIVPPLALPQEYELEERFAGETNAQDEEPVSVSNGEVEAEPIADLHDVMETVESLETVEPDFVAEERGEEPIPMPTIYRNSAELPVTLPEPSWLTVEPEPVALYPLLQVSLPVLEDTAVPDSVVVAARETPAAVAIPQEASQIVPRMLPPVRIDSAFRDNWLVVTAREAGGMTVLPTVTMRMQSQPNQSLQMRSTAMGEMPTSETPLVIMESREESGSEPSALRVEIAYSPDAPDVVFEVSSQVEDEVQISMADKGSDLCASWEVNKQKGNYARAKATISRKSGDPEVLIDIQRFRDPNDADVWCSLLSFSVLGR